MLLSESDLDLRAAERFLSGKLSTAKLVVRPYKRIDQLLSAYGLAISCPEGTQLSQRITYPPVSEDGDWALFGPPIDLFRLVYKGTSLKCNSLVVASYQYGLHHSADRTGAQLRLPAELVAMAEKYENDPNGMAVRFYRRRKVI